MLVIFVTQVSKAYGGDAVARMAEGHSNFMSLFLVISIVFAKAALVLMPLKALATHTTNLCEGEGNSLGHKV